MVIVRQGLTVDWAVVKSACIGVNDRLKKQFLVITAEHGLEREGDML